MPDISSILIVDDDADIRNVLSLILSSQYQVAEAENGLAALEYIQAHPDTDLVIMDVMMPGMNGYEACDALRDYSNAPVLFLTAKSAEDDRLAAYRSGGDDFISKPFSQQELVAKIGSLLRRYKQYRGKPEPVYQVADVVIDPSSHTISKAGEVLPMTETEYLIFEYLMKNRGSTVTTPELYEKVWGEKFLPGSANTVMVHVLNIRKKIETSSSSPKIIRTVWGKGYQID